MSSSNLQEAMVAEMLGDVALLHEQVEKLPDALQHSLAPVLESVTQTIRQAQTAIDGYTKAQQPIIRQLVATEITALHKALKNQAGEVLNGAAQSLEASAQVHETAIRAHRRQGGLLVLVAILVAVISSGVSLAGGYLLFGQQQAAQAELGRATLSVWHNLDVKTRNRIQRARQ